MPLINQPAAVVWALLAWLPAVDAVAACVAHSTLAAQLPQFRAQVEACIAEARRHLDLFDEVGLLTPFLLEPTRPCVAIDHSGAPFGIARLARRAFNLPLDRLGDMRRYLRDMRLDPGEWPTACNGARDNAPEGLPEAVAWLQRHMTAQLWLPCIRSPVLPATPPATLRHWPVTGLRVNMHMAYVCAGSVGIGLVFYEILDFASDSDSETGSELSDGSRF